MFSVMVPSGLSKVYVYGGLPAKTVIGFNDPPLLSQTESVLVTDKTVNPPKGLTLVELVKVHRPASVTVTVNVPAGTLVKVKSLSKLITY